MRSDLTDITLVVDRSGSMQSVKQEAEGGINGFIEEQKKQPGDALFTLVQFDTDYEFVHRGVPIRDVGPFALVPRGWTALLDAVGRAINETGERLSAMKDEDRPGLVVFVITTDGLENSSHEFTRSAIKEMIERQQRDYNWKFTYLGANQDAFAEAGQMGIPVAASAGYSEVKTSGAFRAASSNVARMRAASASGDVVACAYTEEERESMK